MSLPSCFRLVSPNHHSSLAMDTVVHTYEAQQTSACADVHNIKRSSRWLADISVAFCMLEKGHHSPRAYQSVTSAAAVVARPARVPAGYRAGVGGRGRGVTARRRAARRPGGCSGRPRRRGAAAGGAGAGGGAHAARRDLLDPWHFAGDPGFWPLRVRVRIRASGPQSM